MRKHWMWLVPFLSENLEYERGQLAYITRMFDQGLISLTLNEFNNLTPYQKLALSVISEEIIRFRKNSKPFVIF